MSMPIEWLERFQPTPMYLVVEREESTKAMSTLIELPASFGSRRRSAIGTILSTSGQVPPYPTPFELEPGMRVLIAAGVGRKVVFGKELEERRTVYLVAPTEVIGVITDDTIEATLEDSDPRRFGEAVPVGVRADAKDKQRDMGEAVDRGE